MTGITKGATLLSPASVSGISVVININTGFGQSIIKKQREGKVYRKRRETKEQKDKNKEIFYWSFSIPFSSWMAHQNPHYFHSFKMKTNTSFNR